MSNKWRYRVKQGIYQSLVLGEDAYDECMPCAWYGKKCRGDGTNKHCRYRQIKLCKTTMKKLEKYRKEYKKWKTQLIDKLEQKRED